MKHASLFSGIGGFDLAAQWMGWNNVFQVEWDDWCQQILTKNFPDVPKFRDIVEFNKMLQNGEIVTDTESKRIHRVDGNYKKEKGQNRGRASKSYSSNQKYIRIQRPDIITGGFPCQPFSHAGKRGGESDERYLWPEMLTAIRTLKPAYVVGENVAGLISMEGGKTLDTILTDLENEGYTVESFVIPACAVGAWHRRDRIWIVAYNDSLFRGTDKRESYTETDGRDYPSGLCEDVCNTESKGLQRRDGVQESEGFNKGCKDVPDTISQRGCSGEARGEDAENVREQSRNTQHGYWNSEPPVGRVAPGLPLELDEYWNREPEGVPRVATGMKDRVNRLKGLGNAIVPQVAFEIFKAIELAELNNQ